MRSARFLHLIALLALLLAIPLPFYAQAAGSTVLTNADIVKMMKAGLPESVIVREIQMSPSDFGTSPAALIDLQRHGASENILHAVLDSRMGAGQPAMAPPPPHTGQSLASGLNHLPSFEADMKFKGNTDGKIKVGHNNIRVEKSGVPLFSLKWKDPAPPAK